MGQVLLAWAFRVVVMTLALAVAVVAMIAGG